MKIRELRIPDIKYESLNKSKIELADKIISSFLPIIQPKISDKLKELKNLRESVNNKKKKVTQEKVSLQELQTIIQKKKKINLLLNRIEQLTTIGIDESLKSEMITVIRKINDLSDEKINFYLEETLRIISRKFSKMGRE